MNPIEYLKSLIYKFGPQWNLFGHIDNMKSAIEEIEKPKIPKNWVVFEAGQSLTDFLWYVSLINFEDLLNGVENPRQVYVEEKDSFHEALYEGIQIINSNSLNKPIKA